MRKRWGWTRARTSRRKLGAGDRAYLADCRAKEDAAQAEAEARRREREEEQARKLADAEAIAAAKQRVASRTRVGLVAALALAVVAAGFGFYAWREKAIAVDQTREAELQRDAADAAKTVAVEREFRSAAEPGCGARRPVERGVGGESGARGQAGALGMAEAPGGPEP